MSLDNHKITTYADNVADLPDYPSDAGYSAKQLKAIFDGRGDKEIKEKFNALIDELMEIIAGLETANDSAEQNAKEHAEGLVSMHNTADGAHNDIRILVSELTRRLNALADSDDTTLDQLSELVAYIKDNRELIEVVTTAKANVSDVERIDSLIRLADEKISEHIADKSNPHKVTAAQLGIMPGTGGGMAENVGSGLAIVSVHDDLTSIIPDDGEMYIVKYDNMPAYDENKELIITDTVRYRIFIGDGITPLSELLPISNLQGGEGTGSIVQIDPTYDKGDDRYYSPNEAPGQLSAALGKYNNVPGKASMAVNYDNLVEADRAFAAGWGNRIGASAIAAFIAGFQNIVLNKYQASFGMYNNPDDLDALFMIGAGTGENDRKNAFTVCKDGTIKFDGKVFDISKYDSIAELSGEIRQLSDQLNIPVTLGADVDGKLIAKPMEGTLTERAFKFYTNNGHSDVVTNGTLEAYSEYPDEGSGSDRTWAFLGTVATRSTSSGNFTSLREEWLETPTMYSDEWIAFKIKVPKTGKYVLHENWGFYKNGGKIESYIIPMTDEMRAEFAPDNTETYGVISNAELEGSPDTMKRENFKYFSDLTSVQGAEPIGVIYTRKAGSIELDGFENVRIGTVELSEGEHVLILRVVKSSGSRAAMVFRDFTLSTFEPLTDAVYVRKDELEDAIKAYVDKVISGGGGV